MKIHFRDSGQRFAEDHGVKTKKDGDAEPEKEQKRNDVLRPPVAIFQHAVCFAQCSRDGRDKDCAEINSENDSGVCEQAARAGYDNAGRGSVENVLHLGIGREETFQDAEYAVQLGRVGAKKPKQMPKKKQTRRERDQQRVGHLRGQTGRVVGGRFPNQAPKNSPDEAQHFHATDSLLCPT